MLRSVGDAAVVAVAVVAVVAVAVFQEVETNNIMCSIHICRNVCVI